MDFIVEIRHFSARNNNEWKWCHLWHDHHTLHNHETFHCQYICH